MRDPTSRPTAMHYVYLLRSLSAPAQTYIGYSTDLRTRLATHNRGGSPHTAKHLPWRLDAYLAFTTKTRALAFERYLQSHSGKAFATKRLWSTSENASSVERDQGRCLPEPARGAARS